MHRRFFMMAGCYCLQDDVRRKSIQNSFRCMLSKLDSIMLLPACHLWDAIPKQQLRKLNMCIPKTWLDGDILHSEASPFNMCFKTNTFAKLERGEPVISRFSASPATLVPALSQAVDVGCALHLCFKTSGQLIDLAKFACSTLGPFLCDA